MKIKQIKNLVNKRKKSTIGTTSHFFKADPNSLQSNVVSLDLNKKTQPFSCLDTLHPIASKYKHIEKPFKNTLLVAIQHFLGTTVDMLKVMKELGLNHAVIGGKLYSTHTESAKEISELGFKVISDKKPIGYGRFNDYMAKGANAVWEAALKQIYKHSFDNIIILDDGADLLRATPHLFKNKKIPKKPYVFGIEQTTNGSDHARLMGLPFPIIKVSGAYIKKLIEYPSIGEIVSNKVLKEIETSILPNINKKPVIGIIGFGWLGDEIFTL